MMQQGPVDPDNPAANMQKYMMYIAPFFALTGLYWQFGLVIYWVTTNIWTLGQQHILFRNLPVVGSATVGASAVQAASGNTGVTGKSSTGKLSSSVKAALTGKTDEPQDSVPKTGTAKTSVPKTSAARTTGTKSSAANASAPKTGAPKASAPKSAASKPNASKASANGSSSPSAPASPSTGGARGLLRLGKTKPEPEAVPAAPQTKTVRQQPTRQTRSKRSGNKR